MSSDASPPSDVDRLEHDLAAVPETPEDDIAAKRAQRIAGAAVIGVVLALVALWALTPAREWANAQRLSEAASQLSDSIWGLPAALGAFLVGGLVAFPVNLLTATCVLVFDPLRGACYALAGTMLSAVFLYEVGARLARQRIRALAGARLMRVSERIARRGLVAIIFVRIVPVAPFSLTCLVAGASHIGRRDYLLGTLLGMLPGIVMAALFIDRVMDALKHPGPTTYALLAAVVLLIAAAMFWLRRHFLRAAAQDVVRAKR